MIRFPALVVRLAFESMWACQQSTHWVLVSGLSYAVRLSGSVHGNCSRLKGRCLFVVYASADWTSPSSNGCIHFPYGDFYVTTGFIALLVFSGLFKGDLYLLTGSTAHLRWTLVNPKMSLLRLFCLGISISLKVLRWERHRSLHDVLLHSKFTCPSARFSA